MKQTRQQVLESACHVFAETGFHDAGIAEICKRAGANIASVNYYFRSKKDLYVESLKCAFEVAEKRRPLVLSARDIPSPEERLRKYIDAQFHRIFCTGICGCAARMIAHEMTNPTFAHSGVFSELLAPRFESLESVVADLLGKGAPEPQLKLCALSVASLFSFYQFDKNARQALLGQKSERPQILEDAVQHTFDFAMAGIESTRNALTVRH